LLYCLFSSLDLSWLFLYAWSKPSNPNAVAFGPTWMAVIPNVKTTLAEPFKVHAGV